MPVASSWTPQPFNYMEQMIFYGYQVSIGHSGTAAENELRHQVVTLQSPSI